MLEREDEYKYEDVDFNIDEYLSRVQAKSDTARQGILVLPTEHWRQSSVNVFMPETFDFVKWMRQNSTIDVSINIATVEDIQVAEMRSDNFWFPLAYLFNDISVQIYLNIVASYLYDRIKGALRADQTTVDLELLTEDKKKGRVKRFSYHGSYEGLKEIIEKMDKFME